MALATVVERALKATWWRLRPHLPRGRRGQHDRTHALSDSGFLFF